MGLGTAMAVPHESPDKVNATPENRTSLRIGLGVEPISCMKFALSDLTVEHLDLAPAEPPDRHGIATRVGHTRIDYGDNCRNSHCRSRLALTVGLPPALQAAAH